MPQTILIAHRSETARHRLCAILQTGAFRLLEASDAEQVRGLLHQLPDLMLLDAQMALEEGNERLSDDCLVAEIPCLFISSPRHPLDQGRPLAPWSAGTICHPEDAEEVLYKVRSQLVIKQLALELNLAQERLLAERIEREESLKSAAHIQKSLVPSRAPNIRQLEFAWRFQPCEKVGGDLYNFSLLEEKTLMAYVLDVSGHGISSAMVAVSVSQALSPQPGHLLKRGLDTPPFYEIAAPSEVLDELDREYPFERFEMFFTISYLLVDIHTGRVRYSNAAHPPPVVVRNGGKLELLTEGGTIIGAGGVVPFEEGEVILKPGDRLYLYSDGVLEQFNAAGEMFGMERFARQLATGAASSIGASCNQVVGALKLFGEGTPQQDDITIVAMEFRGND